MEDATSRLDSAWRALDTRWHATKAVWNDGVRREFERDFIASLEQQVPAMRGEMERLAYVLQMVQRTVH